MKITLVENGLDFILSALEYAQLNEVNGRGLKYSVLHLADGVELILKEKLRREHWSLLFADVNKAAQEGFKTGDFKSVDFEECVKRLENILALDLKAHIELLRILRRIRNKLQHFEYEGSREQVISILVRTWSFILDFLHTHLPDVVKDQDTTIEKIKQLMVANEQFLEERLAEIQPKIDAMEDAEAVLKCPFCLQEALYISGVKDPNCVFCYYTASPEEAVVEWCNEIFGFQDPKERYTDPLWFECPECGSETLVQQEFGGMTPPIPEWVCFSCGQTWGHDGIRFCDNCGEPYHTGVDDYGICQDCEKTQMEKR